MKIRTNGFTLIEMLGVVALAGIGTATLIDMGKENLNAENKQFITDRIVSVMEGFDKRIAKDGYDAAVWDTKSWTDNQQVLIDLFDNQLDLNINTIPLGLTISASLNSDNVNFVDEFELVLGYESADDFEANQKMFTALQYELSGKAINTVSGDVEYGYYHKTTNASLSRLECNKAKNDCLLKASWFRYGGHEYINVDGSNSLIAEHLTFIEGYGQSPLKCIRWSEQTTSGVKKWHKETVEECGIGIYKKINEPLLAELNVNTFLAKAVMLDKQCKVFDHNGTKVVDTGKTSPCGMLNNGTDVVQIIETTMAENSIYNQFYSENSNINQLITDEIITEHVEVNTIKVFGLTTIKDLIAQNATLNNFKVVNNATFEGDAVMNIENTSFKNKPEIKNLVQDNITVTDTMQVNGLTEVKSVDDVVSVRSYGANTVASSKADEMDVSKDSNFGELSSKGYIDSAVKMSAPIGDFDNINKRIAELEAMIKTKKEGKWVLVGASGKSMKLSSSKTSLWFYGYKETLGGSCGSVGAKMGRWFGGANKKIKDSKDYYATEEHYKLFVKYNGASGWPSSCGFTGALCDVKEMIWECK
ncbi:prepilin-type N-terminal cleavage/methylation domain-containing protein [Vibrio parahaemolyticus]|nr:prepilin-type N-terminal cleavage/methylation domain-containing protein [Vibrio parahaemolyticus]EJR2787917.1 prepilin-type N-terminal cleavage/methylation domain-containing protein [Vibrio parahaemolyticus]